MHVLLLSAYDAASHRQWRRGLVAAMPDWHWTQLTLPPRNFSWRVRGNSLSWGRGEAAELMARPWDLVVATSMTDLAALRGLVPRIGLVPTAVYFHENQFAYPRSEKAAHSIEPQMLNIYTALCGDMLLFNSEFNRRTLLEGAERLLRRLPDCVPAGICEEIAAKSYLLPVPLEDALFEAETQQLKGRPFTLSWAARWEYDKRPDRLLHILQGLEAAGVDFRLNMLGQTFRNSPEEFALIRRDFAHRLLSVGFVEDKNQYRGILRQSHVFLSTAAHEFQGLAAMEASALGCSPLVPDEQAYPDYYPREMRFADVPDAIAKLCALAERHQMGRELPLADFSRYRWKLLGEKYRHLLVSITGGGKI
ncbi:DUF3524 domain-containing protein [Microbulbifer sp. TYP-18]|uniref:tRNA-queuosine alpha-mannosyltransferase domain-containing protein n=1 Tax=Microbulbifer sp. TYP-18 TaxID=3230024 RepID=UPI0034C68F89